MYLFIALLSIAFVGGKGLLCCKCKYIVHIIELSYVFKIGKMKVDNLVVLTLLYLLIWTFLPKPCANLSLACIKMQLHHVGISHKVH